MMSVNGNTRRKATTSPITSTRSNSRLATSSTIEKLRLGIAVVATLTLLLFVMKRDSVNTTASLQQKRLKSGNNAMSPSLPSSSSSNNVKKSEEIITIKSFRATGKVQRVMFRQTLIRAMQKLGLVGGATNRRKPNRNQVDFTIQGTEPKIKELIERFLDTSKPINDRHAQAENIIELSFIIPIHDHTVTTDNVDNFKWQPCEMYI